MTTIKFLKMKFFVRIFAVFFFLVNIPNGSECLKKREPEVNPAKNEDVNGIMWNFLASIRLKIEDDPFGSDHRCGGALISYNKVITAAQCLIDTTELDLSSFFSPSAFMVVLGTPNLHIQTPDTIISDVDYFRTHESFDSNITVNNIAVLFLRSPVPHNHSKVVPVHISKMRILPGHKCTTSGFGHSTFGASRSNLATSIEVVIIQMSHCIVGPKNDSFADTFFCVGKETGDKTLCQADLGGPLVCNDSLAGIVSHGLDCAKPESAALFTNVAHYKKWIASVSLQKQETLSSRSPVLKTLCFFVFSCFVIIFANV